MSSMFWSGFGAGMVVTATNKPDRDFLARKLSKMTDTPTPHRAPDDARPSEEAREISIQFVL